MPNPRVIKETKYQPVLAAIKDEVDRDRLVIFAERILNIMKDSYPDQPFSGDMAMELALALMFNFGHEMIKREPRCRR
jgi:hypothetical protein